MSASNVASTISNVANTILTAILNFFSAAANFIVQNADIFIAIATVGGLITLLLKFGTNIPILGTLLSQLGLSS